MVSFLYILGGFQSAVESFGSNWKVFLFLFFCSLFIVLSVVLLILIFKKRISGNLKKFLLLSGISPLAMVASIILHNLVYSLFIFFFGADFWERIGMSDEPFFFFLATIVCPAAFLIGLVGSFILLFRSKRN